MLGASERMCRFSGGNGCRSPARSPGKQERKRGGMKRGKKGKKRTGIEEALFIQ